MYELFVLLQIAHSRPLGLCGLSTCSLYYKRTRRIYVRCIVQYTRGNNQILLFVNFRHGTTPARRRSVSWITISRLLFFQFEIPHKRFSIGEMDKDFVFAEEIDSFLGALQRNIVLIGEVPDIDRPHHDFE